MAHFYNQKRLSKFLSLVLRHEAAKFGLTLDKYGWAPIDRVVSILQTRQPGFTQEDLVRLARDDSKQRYEIVDDRIRARYGHSLEVEPSAVPAEPPEILYHGTAGRTVPVILREGLRSMSRRFVHLSPNKEDALKVGRRHSANVVLLKIGARVAHEAGVRFYCEENIYLATQIPAEFIEVVES